MAVFVRKLKRISQKVLIARTDNIGDFVLSLPVFEVMGKDLGIDFSVLCRNSVTPLLNNNPFVNDVITIGSGKQPKEVIREIESGRFDTLLVLVNNPTIRTLLPHLRAIPVRIGPLSRLSVLFNYTHPVIQKRSRSVFNEAEYNLELLEIFGQKAINPINPKLYFSDDEIRDFKLKFKVFSSNQDSAPFRVVFHAGMRGSALNWSESHYCELLTMLLEKDVLVVLTGSGDSEVKLNKNLVDCVETRFPEQLHNLTEQLSLRELAVAMTLSGLYIGPSTGPTHIANAAGTPLISFYPPLRVQSAKRWEPFLADSRIFTPQVHCGQKYSCIGNKCDHYNCMDSISAEDVITEVEKVILNGTFR